MLHYVHQQVANCVCMLFGAEQVENSLSLLFTENILMRAMTVNQNSKVWGPNPNYELKDVKELCGAEGIIR